MHRSKHPFMLLAVAAAVWSLCCCPSTAVSAPVGGNTAFLMADPVHLDASDLGISLMMAMQRIDSLTTQLTQATQQLAQAQEELSLTRQSLQAHVTQSNSRLTELESRANNMELLKPSSSALVTSVLASAAGVTNLERATPGYKNRLFNGEFSIITREVVGQPHITSTVETIADGWQVVYNDGSDNVLQWGPTGPRDWELVGSRTCLQLSMPTGDPSPLTPNQYAIVFQTLPFGAIADFAWGTPSASPVTLSFWVSNKITGTWGGSVRNMAGTRSFPFNYTNTQSGSGNWFRVSFTIPGDTCSTCGWTPQYAYQSDTPAMQVVLTLRAGSNYQCTPKTTWQNANCMTVTGQTPMGTSTTGVSLIQITAVQLEKGSVATAYDFRPYKTELVPAGTMDTLRGAGSGLKNRVINGAFNVDQLRRGAELTVTASTGFVVDRWQMTRAGPNTAGLFAVRQMDGRTTLSIEPPQGFLSYLQIRTLAGVLTPASTDSAYLWHTIERSNVLDFNYGEWDAKPVTLSFMVRSSVPGVYSGALRSRLNPTYARAYVFNYVITAANTWQRIELTIAGEEFDSGLVNRWPRSGVNPEDGAIDVVLNLLAGSSMVAPAASLNQWYNTGLYGTAGQANFAAVTGATILFTGIQLERSPYATAFDARSVATETQLVQRFITSFGFSSTPTLLPAVSLGAGSDDLLFRLRLPVPMRGMPVLTVAGTCEVVQVLIPGGSTTATSGWTWSLYAPESQPSTTGEVTLRAKKNAHGVFGAGGSSLAVHCPTSNDGFILTADI